MPPTPANQEQKNQEQRLFSTHFAVELRACQHEPTPPTAQPTCRPEEDAAAVHAASLPLSIVGRPIGKLHLVRAVGQGCSAPGCQHGWRNLLPSGASCCRAGLRRHHSPGLWCGRLCHRLREAIHAGLLLRTTRAGSGALAPAAVVAVAKQHVVKDCKQYGNQDSRQRSRELVGSHQQAQEAGPRSWQNLGGVQRPASCPDTRIMNCYAIAGSRAGRGGAKLGCGRQRCGNAEQLNARSGYWVDQSGHISRANCQPKNRACEFLRQRHEKVGCFDSLDANFLSSRCSRSPFPPPLANSSAAASCTRRAELPPSRA